MFTEDESKHERSDATVSATVSKKRKVQRACDICRRKKIRCDGGEMRDNRCSNCVVNDFDCTYVEVAKKRGPSKGYVEGLEHRVRQLEEILRKFCPDANYNQDMSSKSKTEQRPDETMVAMRSIVHRTSLTPVLPKNPTSTLHPTANDPTLDEEILPSSDDEYEQQTLAESLKMLELNPKHPRFLGKSSGAGLVQAALDVRTEFAKRDKGFVAAIFQGRRPEFWTVHHWELLVEEHRPSYAFPEEDLLESLVRLYFNHINVYIPVLHRPTFERSVADGLHLKDNSFGAIVLLVCALGSRYSDDPRIFLEGSDSTHTCGWKWFIQVQTIQKSLLSTTSLYDLQYYCLLVLFMQGSSVPPTACWTRVGIGIRLAQDVGAHRKKVYNRKPTVDDELWKRAFWILVCVDRGLSSSLGQPCAIHDEDFDLDFPIECDDEYWENSDAEQTFKQPSNKPSVIAYYNCYIKLTQILAFALRTIYSINKSKILLGFVGPKWEQEIVSELDSALNKWIDSVPDHLRWDPQREDIIFFNQSAFLYAFYYYVQIVIHRPFIPSPRKPSPLSFPSLAICANAARSCSRVIDIHRLRNSRVHPHVLLPAFASCVILLLTMWSGKRSGLSFNSAKEMADVHKCMETIRGCEERWNPAGRLIDILGGLAYIGDLPLEQPVSLKREMNDDAQNVSACCATSSPSTCCNSDVPGRCVTGTQSVTTADSHSSSVHYPQGSLPRETHPLPMYSNELGRLPVHDHFDALAQDAVLDVTDNFEWYPPHGGIALAPEYSAPRWGPMNAVANSGLSGVGDGTTFYTMDQLFFDQMTTKFADPTVKNFAESEIHSDQPPYQQSGSDARSFFSVPLFDGSTGPQPQGRFNTNAWGGPRHQAPH